MREEGAAQPVPEPLTAKQVRHAGMSSSPNVAPGLSGLSIEHLQRAIRCGSAVTVNKLLAALAWLGTSVFASSKFLPSDFWRLHSAARLSAIGEKARPIACGDTLRQLFGRIYNRSQQARFASLFEAVGQFGVAVKDGVERAAAMAQLVHQEGGHLIALDGKNAFNSVSRSAILEQAAAHVPEVFAYILRLYAQSARQPLFSALMGWLCRPQCPHGRACSRETRSDYCCSRWQFCQYSVRSRRSSPTYACLGSSTTSRFCV